MTSNDIPNTVSLKDLAAILARRKRQILLVFFLVLAGVVAGTFLMPKKYETHMKVLVKNERADIVVSPDSNGSPIFRNEVSEAQINSEIELLTSKNLLRQVVTKCGLDRLPWVFESDPIERHFVAIEKALKRLEEKDLEVTAVKKANIIQVDYVDEDPRRAVAVLASLGEGYLEAHLKVHGTPGTYEFFKGQAERYQLELKDAESKLADFRRRENIVILDEQKTVTLQKAADSESALMEAEAAVGEYAQRIVDGHRQLASSAPRVVTLSRTVPNQYSVERLHTMLAELQNRRTLLLAKFRPDDRMVQEADQEISDTQVALEKANKLTGVEQSTDVNPLHQTVEIDLAKQQTELAGLENRRQTLARQSWTYRRQLMKLGDATATFDDLVRTQKKAEDDYLLYAKKAEEARIGDALDRVKIANVAIAETPVEPHSPSKPKIILNLVLGVFLAGFVSLGAAFAAEYFRDAVEQPCELEELTGLPVLATSYGD
jgi:uncharacterized protein involved in exopolysaccharide biosynthesis